MEFDDQFYQNLFRLVATDLKNTEATDELFRIFQKVKQHYVDNGITELWRPIGSSVSSVVGGLGSEYLEVPVSSKRQSIAPIRRESLLSETDSTSLIGQSKSPAHSGTIDTSKNPTSLIYDSPGLFSSSLKSELLSADDHNSFSAADFGDSQDSSSAEPLRLVANFEENDESVNVVVEQSSAKQPKTELDDKDADGELSVDNIPLDVENTVDVSSSTTIADDLYLNAPSPKIRRLAHERRSDSPSIVKVKNLDKMKSTVKQEVLEESVIENMCATCKSTAFTLGNSLVECHQCHTFYHQKCHNPNVPQSHINDPRSLWYCAVCSKKMKKTITTPVNTKDNVKKPSSIKTKAEDPEKEKQHRQFLEAAAKRVEHKVKTEQTSKVLYLFKKYKNAIFIEEDYRLYRDDFLSNEMKQNSLKKPVATLAADFLAKHKGRTNMASASKPSSLNLHSPSILSSSFGSSSNPSSSNVIVVKTPTSESAPASGLTGLSKLAVVQQQRPSTSTQPAAGPSISGAGRPAVKTPGSGAATSNVAGSATAAQKKLLMMKKKAAEKKNLIR